MRRKLSRLGTSHRSQTGVPQSDLFPDGRSDGHQARMHCIVPFGMSYNVQRQSRSALLTPHFLRSAQVGSRHLRGASKVRQDALRYLTLMHSPSSTDAPVLRRQSRLSTHLTSLPSIFFPRCVLFTPFSNLPFLAIISLAITPLVMSVLLRHLPVQHLSR